MEWGHNTLLPLVSKDQIRLFKAPPGPLWGSNHCARYHLPCFPFSRYPELGSPLDPTQPSGMGLGGGQSLEPTTDTAPVGRD